MKFSLLCGVSALLCCTLVRETIAGDVAFAEVDQSYSEGRGQDNLFLTKDVTSEDVPVIIRLFSVSEFNAYRIREGRNVSDEDQARIDLIEVPAESGADFNNTPIEITFLADDEETIVQLNDNIIIDDLLNEATEGFVMVLQANNSGVINRDILRFNIFDNDAVSIGFEYIVFAFGEDAGVLTDEFRVIIQNGVISEQNLTVTVTIFVFNGSSNGATPDYDFRPVDGLYTYTLTIYAGNSYAFINRIEIIDDALVEGNETFYIMLTSTGPAAPVDPDRMLAMVTIIDNDVVTASPTPTPPPTPSPSETPTVPPLGMGGDPHYSLMLPTGQLLCFSVHGEKNFPFNLISNSLLQMNAFFIEDARREEITWIGSLGVVVQHSTFKKSNATKMRFDAKEQAIYINNGVSLNAKRVERLTLANGKLTITEAIRKDTEKTAEVEVDLIDVGLAFSVRFVKKRHLDMYWRKVSMQPTDSHGIMGQFLRQGVRIDEVRKLLYLPNLAPVPVMRSSVWHFMERESPDPLDQKYCWQAMNPGYQGKRLIEGSYLDYLVDDVLTPDFKFTL